jgi:hypothetical protein
MITYNNPLATKICDLLKPLVGEMMACGILSSQTKKLGIDPNLLSAQHLALIADNIESGLVVFIGSEAAKTVSKEIKGIS